MQLTDKNGNVYGWNGLEITTSSGKPKVPVINTDITIGTTAVIGGVSGRVLYNNAGVVGELDLSSIYVPTSRTLTINGVTQDLSANRTFTISTGITIGSTAIASGVVGRVLFEGAGNVVQESSGLTYNDTAKAFTLIGPVGSIIQHTALTNYNGLGGLQLNVADGTERGFLKLNPTSGEVRIGATGSGYFPTFYAQGVEAMRIFASTRNVGIGTTTDAGFRLDVNGTARIQSTLSVSGSTTATGVIAANGGINAGILGYGITTIPANTTFFNDTTRVIQSPATWIWHDLFAFDRYSATYETYNGTLWTPANINIELFAQKQSQSIPVITSTILGSRWTFNNTAWGSAQWLVIGISWAASLASISVLVETYDGTAWVTRHTSSVTISANNYFAYVSPYAGDNQMRVTITRTGGGTDLNLSNIKLLTSRPGDQGAGSEVEVPYYWSGNRNMGIGGVSASNTKLIISGTSNSSGGIAAGQRITGQINATANNDVLIGLDIQPTFTNGAFTGVTNLALRTTGQVRLNANGEISSFQGYGSDIFRVHSNANGLLEIGQNLVTPIGVNAKASIYNRNNTYFAISINVPASQLGKGAQITWNNQGQGGGTIYHSNEVLYDMGMVNANSHYLHMFASGNVLLTNGTRTDAGYKLDVNGTARVVGSFIASAAIGAGTGSFALGTLATSASSTHGGALGYDAQSLNSHALAFGYSSRANGHSSVAIGRLSIANAADSVAFHNATSAGINSAAFGNGSTTTGASSMATGSNAYTYLTGQLAVSGGSLNYKGDSQFSIYTSKLNTGIVNSGGTYSFAGIRPSNSAFGSDVTQIWYVECVVVFAVKGRTTAITEFALRDTYSIKYKLAVKSTNSLGTTILGTPVADSSFSDASMATTSVTFTIVSNNLVVNVTPPTWTSGGQMQFIGTAYFGITELGVYGQPF